MTPEFWQWYFTVMEHLFFILPFALVFDTAVLAWASYMAWTRR